MEHGRVQGKKALVTGGISGIGYATASLLRSEGADVVITDINDSGEYDNFVFLHHDIADENSWRRVMEQAIHHHGKLDILVNCAGVNGVAFRSPQDPENMTLDQFRKVMSINAEGTLLGCKYAIAAMKKRGGSIVNIGSLSALLTMPAMTDYACSKSVIRYLTRSVALYCADKGYRIRCNLVTPGATYTPLWDCIFDDAEDRAEQENAIKEKIPLKMWIKSEDVAYAVLYLASDEARCVTGADIVVDGGQLIKGQTTR